MHTIENEIRIVPSMDNESGTRKQKSNANDCNATNDVDETHPERERVEG